eukprot:999927-Alexandrium_andersonii.AAC.1
MPGSPLRCRQPPASSSGKGECAPYSAIAAPWPTAAYRSAIVPRRPRGDSWAALLELEVQRQRCTVEQNCYGNSPLMWNKSAAVSIGPATHANFNNFNVE